MFEVGVSKMRRFVALTLSAIALAAAPLQAAPRLTGEAELARLTEGRVAGEPVKCVYLPQIRSSRIIDDTAIVYEAGRTIYVNRPRSGRESLDSWDTMVVKPFASHLCSIDVVQLYDPGSRMMSGLVFLGDFVPYRKPGR